MIHILKLELLNFIDLPKPQNCYFFNDIKFFIKIVAIFVCIITIIHFCCKTIDM